MIMANSTRYVVLRALLGWDDASTDTVERLVTCAGSVGLTITDNSVEFFSVDAWTREVIRIEIKGQWSYGTIRALAMHLTMIDTIREAG